MGNTSFDGAYACYANDMHMTIYLIRHCSAVGQEADAPLSEAGRHQAVRRASFLKERGVARIVSSPFKRAIDSARPLAQTLGLRVETDDRLAERQLGQVEDGDWVSALRRSVSDRHLCLPNGESSFIAQSRGLAVVNEVFQGAPLPAAIFSHGNLLALIANSFDPSLEFGFWQTLSNPDVLEVKRLGECFEVSRVWT